MTQNYLNLRAATQARDRSLRAKGITLEKAAEIVQDGDHIAIGGCTASRTPLAMIWALIRAKKMICLFPAASCRLRVTCSLPLAYVVTSLPVGLARVSYGASQKS